MADCMGKMNVQFTVNGADWSAAPHLFIAMVTGIDNQN